MRKLLVSLVAVAMSMQAQSQPAGALASQNDGRKVIIRSQQYEPDGNAFICENGTNRFTRALYGGWTDYRVETSDRPVFALVKKGQMRSVRFEVEGVMLVGAGGGNVSDTVYTSTVDFSHKTVYLTADMDMGGAERDGVWSGPNWTPIGGKFPMKREEVSGDCLTLDTRFNGVLDGQGHSITNLY